MEQQFILRLEGNLRELVNLQDAKFERINDHTINLIYKNVVYPGIIVKLPCIVESQKTLDSKQYYKVCDISTLVVIYPNKNYNFEQERKVLELSGLSAPMKYVKERRFSKNVSDKGQIFNEIEQKVNELLEKDRIASKVEIINEAEPTEDEIQNIADEIEEDVKCTTEVPETTGINKETAEIQELRQEIEKQTKLVDGALNPILKQRFNTKLEALKEKLNKLLEE